MNWLYFFVGCTAAWVFMGLTIFTFSILKDLLGMKEQKSVNEQMLDYWKVSMTNQQQQIEAIRDLSLTIYNTYKR